MVSNAWNPCLPILNVLLDPAWSCLKPQTKDDRRHFLLTPLQVLAPDIFPLIPTPDSLSAFHLSPSPVHTFLTVFVLLCSFSLTSPPMSIFYDQNVFHLVSLYFIRWQFSAFPFCRAITFISLVGQVVLCLTDCTLLFTVGLRSLSITTKRQKDNIVPTETWLY